MSFSLNELPSFPGCSRPGILSGFRDRLQWVWLLLFSYLFYLASGTWAAVFILTTTLTTFLGGLCLERADLRLALILRSIGTPIPPAEKRY